jgi:hypothetical protein
MNSRLITFSALVTSLVIAGCDSDTSSWESQNNDLAVNTGVVSQKNFTILSEELQPDIFLAPGICAFTYTELKMTVIVGDRYNRVLTDPHTVHFETEWGLLKNSSCTTVDGTCEVTWTTSSCDDVPADHTNTIMAYTIGEESFDDANGNNLFDDGDTIFDDLEEPYVDANNNNIYDSGEKIIDVPNGNDLTGVNGVHDIGDTFFNGGGCTHSSLCSTVINSIYVWDQVVIQMDGAP